MFGVSVARCASAPAQGAISVTLAHCYEVIATRRVSSSRNRRRGPQPLAHLIVIYHAGLLRHQATTGENRKVRDAPNIEACRECRIFLRIHFQHHRFARHLRRGASHFRGSHAAGSAPVRPEIDKHRNRYIIDNFIEYGFVHRQGLGERRQRRFTLSATARAGQIFCWDTVVLAAMVAGAHYRQERPPSRESPLLMGCLGSPKFTTASQRSENSRPWLHLSASAIRSVANYRTANYRENFRVSSVACCNASSCDE